MKKSKVLSLILAFALILTAIYVPITTAFADAFADANGFVIDGTVLTGYDGPGGEITIPSTVTKIGNGAFRNKGNITKITVPYTVTELGSSILEGSSVESIVFDDAPESVVSKPLVLADLVFNCSYSLKHVVLPKRLANIPSTAFQSCRVLETVTVNNDNSTVNANAFNGIREGVTFFVTDNTVPAYANLIAATSSSKVSVLKKGSDYNKDFVMTYDGVLVKYVGEGGDVVIPVGATEIPNSFFRYGSNGKSPNTTKNSVKSVTIPYTVKKVGQSIFEGINGLEKVTFTNAPEDDTNTYNLDIASYSMQLCTSLTEVIFPSHAVSLKAGTFSGDSSLKLVTFNGEEATFTAGAFNYAASGITCFVKNKECNTYINLSTTNYFANKNGVILKIGQVYDPNFTIDENGVLTNYLGTGGDVVVPVGVTEIANSAFKASGSDIHAPNCDNSSIKSITFPYTVTTVGQSIIEGATACKKIVFEDVPDDVTMPEGHSLTIKSYSFHLSKGVEEFVLPKHTKSVGAGLVNNSTAMKSLTVYSENATFSAAAFSDNNAGMNVFVPNATCATYNSVKAAVGSKKIGILKIGQVSDPNFMMDIEGNVNGYVGTDTEVVIPTGATAIKSGAFKFNKTIKTLTIPYTVKTIETSAFESSKIENIIFEEAPSGQDDIYPLELKAWSFQQCQVSELTIPSRIRGMGNNAFGSLPNLYKIRFKNENFTFPVNAFQYNISYVAVVVPNANCETYNSLKATTGYGTNVYAVIYPNEVSRDFVIDADGRLIKYKGTDTSPEIPSSVKIIGSGAFKSNTSVLRVVVPYTVKEIESSAFSQAKNLKEIIFEDAPVGQESNYELKVNAFSFNESPGITHVDLPTHIVYIKNGAFGSIANLEYLSFRGRNIKYDMTSEFNNQVSYAFRYMNKQVPVFFNRNAQDSQAFLDFTKNVTVIGSDGKGKDYNLFYTNGTPQPYYSFMDNGDAASAFAALDPDFMVDGSGTLKKYLGSAEEVTVPSYVKIIGNEAFSYNSTLRKLNIPKTVEVIESSIVFGCKNIKEIAFEQVPYTQINNYTLQIKGFAFQSTGTKVKNEEGKAIWSDGIEEINLPNYKIKLNGYAFGGIGNLKGIIVNGREIEYTLDGTDLTKARVTSFRSIESSRGAVPVFFHKANKDSQAFTDFVKKLENGNRYLWDYGTGFFFRYLEDDGTPDYSKINPDFLTDGDGYMTKYNGNGGNVVIPYGVVTVDEHAFDSVKAANNILSINFPLTVRKIGTVSFKGLSNLRSVTFNEGLEEIGRYAFDGTSITQITLPSTLKKLESGAFGGLSLIEKITIYSKNVEIADGVNPFANMKGVPTVWVVAGSDTHNRIRNCEGADGTMFIIKTIGSKEYPGYKIINGQLDEYTGTESEIILPEEIKRISPKVFQNNENIKSVVLHSDVISIGESAFEGCKNLKEITLNEGLLKIGNNAFKGTAVEKVYLPSTLKSVSRGAFGDTPIKEVYVYGYNTKLPTSHGYKGAFENVTGLTIYASHGSAAYDYATKFAEKHGFKFKLLTVTAVGANGTEKPDKKKIMFRTQTVSGNKITVDGEEYDIIERGGIVIPADLLDDGAELTVDTAAAAKAAYTVIVVKEKEVYEYELTFEDIPATSSTRNMAFRPYIKYKDKDGNDAYLYGNTIYRNAAAMKNYKDGNN